MPQCRDFDQVLFGVDETPERGGSSVGSNGRARETRGHKPLTPARWCPRDSVNAVVNCLPLPGSNAAIDRSQVYPSLNCLGAGKDTVLSL